MYYMHDSFGKRTELLMHELADATSGALQMSSGILDALGGIGSHMQGIEITHAILLCLSELSWVLFSEIDQGATPMKTASRPTSPGKLQGATF